MKKRWNASLWKRKVKPTTQELIDMVLRGEFGKKPQIDAVRSDMERGIPYGHTMSSTGPRP